MDELKLCGCSEMHEFRRVMGGGCSNPLEIENGKLRRRAERAEAELATARRVIEVRGNVSALLGELLKPGATSDESDGT